MDQNHLPSSPLQHHRHSSSRTPESGPSERQATESNKLNLAPAYQAQPAGPSSTATVTSSSLRHQELEPGPSYMPSDTWAEAGPSTHNIPSPSPWDPTSTQPMASSSRCPSPAAPDFPAEPLTAIPSSSLLTSEPLNRSSSAVTSPVIPHALPTRAHTGKRIRSASLPLATPNLKRHKCRHDPPTPSETRTYALRPPRKERSKLERAEESAEGLRKELDARMSSAHRHLYAALVPPINVATLKGLDANEILKSSQLRHDLLFENLAFRPVNSSSPLNAHMYILPPQGAHRASMSETQHALVMGEVFWDSIREEIATGCRCSRWKVRTPRVHGGALVVGSRVKSSKCSCGGWRLGETEAEWWANQRVGYPSRLPELIKTLREILISLMGSTTPCPNHFAHSFSREALDAHELTCPTVTHALVPELYSALDPEFLTIQVRRKVFSLDLFRKLGDAMKVHCAPVRDALVDDMVRKAMTGDVALGLRKCFDCVEVMKLDIANHQVHALRPYLWKSAVAHEISTFRGMLASAKLTSETSLTQKWVRAASLKVVAATLPAERGELMKSRIELVHRSVAGGFVDLVFGSWCDPAVDVWPPVILRRMAGAAQCQLGEVPLNGKVEIPETLRMDSRRIKNFHAEAIDLAVSHMILVCFKRLYSRAHPRARVGDIKRAVGFAKDDLEEAMSVHGLLTLARASRSETSDLALRLATRIVQPHLPAERPSTASPEDLRNIETTAGAIDQFLQTHVQPHSAAFSQALEQIRQSVTMILTHVLLHARLDGHSREQPAHAGNPSDAMEVDTAPAASAPVPPSVLREQQDAIRADLQSKEDALMDSCGISIRKEIRDVVTRMAKVAAFNLQAFEGIYSGIGMVVGRKA